MNVLIRTQQVVGLSLVALIFGIGCTDSTLLNSSRTTPSALEADTGPNQELGDNFIPPPSETVPPQPGPDPKLCIGAVGVASVEEPFGNTPEEEAMSFDWALTDFQPQSCAFEATYGLQGFQGQVTLVALLASW